MNAKQRNKNRATARELRASNRVKNAQPCPRCGVKGLHWVQWPETFEDNIIGVTLEGTGFVMTFVNGEDGEDG